MVGYRPNDSMTPQEKLIAGCLSGVVTRFVTQPLDVVKLRVQLQKKKKKLLKTTTKILREEGAWAFWHGHKLGQIHSVLAVGCQFHSFEWATKVASGTYVGQNYKNVSNFLCGWFAGCFSATVVNPLEVIRVRQMVISEQYNGLINGAKEVYKSGGILAFYGGLNASLLQMGPAVGISFCVFSFVQPLILNYGIECADPPCDGPQLHRPENILLASTVAGSLAGLISKTLTYPFDLAKRRMQIAVGFTGFRKPGPLKGLHGDIGPTRRGPLENFNLKGYVMHLAGPVSERISALNDRPRQSHIHKEGVTIPSTSRHLRKCHTLRECLRLTFKHEGFLGLFTGLKVTLYKAQVTSIIAFTSYELLCYAAREFEIREQRERKPGDS